nr:large subunit ribosomal protein L18 [uncultured archaeon]
MNMLKRRRTMKTDYVQRLALLKSGKPRLVIKRSLNNIHVQVISFENNADKTNVDVFSKALRKHGWKGHCGNISAAYLTGYLAGLMAVKRGIKEANVDIGLQSSRSSALFAVAAGARDAGVRIAIGKEILPGMDRIKGKHVADYAAKLKGTDKYQKQFSAYLKAGLAPEDLPKHFEETKEKLSAEFNVKIAKAAE